MHRSTVDVISIMSSDDRDDDKRSSTGDHVALQQHSQFKNMLELLPLLVYTFSSCASLSLSFHVSSIPLPLSGFVELLGAT